MEFRWNDGGRAASGFVGLCGDCVTRSIAIATGIRYRDVYQELAESAEKSPRNGMGVAVAEAFLSKRGWIRFDGQRSDFSPLSFPLGRCIVHLAKPRSNGGHFSTLIDGVVHDTWNPAEDDYKLVAYWTLPADRNVTQGSGTEEQDAPEASITQQQFDKILRRLRAMDNTARNDASSEGEKRNALLMMQTLMFQHNLTRADLEGQSNTDGVLFTRVTCVLNGSKACTWEHSIANYVCSEIFPFVQYYMSRKGKRSLFHFYGPRSDAENGMELFRELILTIATSATIRFGGYSRGSGASYAEGYARGLPRSQGDQSQQHSADVKTSSDLIQRRTLMVLESANQWLDVECGVKLQRIASYGRQNYDGAAAGLGKTHGATHEIAKPNRPSRLTYSE